MVSKNIFAGRTHKPQRASIRPGLPAGDDLANHRHQPFTNSTI